MNIKNKAYHLKTLLDSAGTLSFYSSFTKRTSLVIFIAFLTVTMHNFAYANESMPTLAKVNLTLPDLPGKILEVFQGQSSKNIYLINDLHCDYTRPV
ncbi:MAG: hypothetical protein GY817_01480 [bacterium]|nr:hypothetical protein [bacterium]